MILIDTKDINHLLKLGVGPIQVHTVHRLEGNHGKIMRKYELGNNIHGQRFTHIILSRQDLVELLAADVVTIHGVMAHFRPTESSNAN